MKNNKLKKVTLTAFAAVGLIAINIDAASAASRDRPNTPSGPVVKNVTSTTATIGFTDQTGSETGYSVSHYINGSYARVYGLGILTVSQLYRTGAVTYDLSGLRPGTEYKYVIRAHRINCAIYERYFEDQPCVYPAFSKPLTIKFTTHY